MLNKNTTDKSGNLANKEVRKILVAFLSGIGNFVLFTPTLRSLKNRFPDAEITLLMKQKVNADFIDGEGLIDHYVQYSNGSSSLKALLSQISVIKGERKKAYDLLITTFDAIGWKLGLSVKLISPEYSVGYRSGKWYDRFYDKLLDYDPAAHEINRHMMISRFLGIEENLDVQKISGSGKERDFAMSVIPPDASLVVGIHPGSSEFLRRKRWMPECFAELADHINERYGAIILILGGSGEVRLAQEVAGHMKTANPVILAGKTQIREVVAVIEQCKIFISNDSGLMHVASAVKTPVVAVFGPTDPAKNAPLGKNNIVIQKDIGCNPCRKYIKGECSDLKCLKGISVQEVLSAVEKKFSLMGINKENEAVNI